MSHDTSDCMFDHTMATVLNPHRFNPHSQTPRMITVARRYGNGRKKSKASSPPGESSVVAMACASLARARDKASVLAIREGEVDELKIVYRIRLVFCSASI